MLPHHGVRLRRSETDRTVRQPDLLVAHLDLDRSPPYVEADRVALVVEVVSPSSIERDWVTMRGEYARAGIPAYLVIEPGDGPADQPRLVLFDRLVTDERGDAAYADPTGDGTTVTIRVGGRDITVAAADLAG